ncbi:Tautomerase/MIF superfamily [Massariosphaeria phaeospora]|uniref:L-dopachrome isomerase n=1 Tax=Massariosphaeria phaeospora TaxID=100035 RepID=A0A7C8MBB4_9PLEO|nr:Tautomerase/MIF superfamily [Massariosphaeria phaeospora]
MSRPSSATSSANAFPRPAGTTLLAPEPVGGQLSPARSTFSFDSSPQSVPGSERVTFDDTANTQSSKTIAGVVAPLQSKFGSRRRTQYYEDQFAYKEDSTSSARERVAKYTPIIAELRTNVIIKDEYTLVTDFSHHMSTRYQRPETSIMIMVNHSACLLLDGTFEPTYVLTISALPVQLQPTTNKRNAALIQSFLSETIGVPPERGIIKFVPILEDNLAINGMTVLGDIERQHAEQFGTGLKRAMTKSSKRSAVTKAKSSIQLSRNNSKANTGGRSAVTPPLPSPGPFDSGVAVDKATGDQLGPLQSVDSRSRKTSVSRKASKFLSEKSGVKTSTKPVHDISPPPIPRDSPTPRIGKRKSFIAIFRR